jgi:hypothetical protein
MSIFRKENARPLTSLDSFLNTALAASLALIATDISLVAIFHKPFKLFFIRVHSHSHRRRHALHLRHPFFRLKF